MPRLSLDTNLSSLSAISDCFTLTVRLAISFGPGAMKYRAANDSMSERILGAVFAGWATGGIEANEEARRNKTRQENTKRRQE
jgi:hypothetical protein